MFHRGKLKLVATWGAMLGISISSVGCQIADVPPAGTNGSPVTFPTSASNQGQASGTAGNRQGGENYPSSAIQRVSYKGDDANGQPIYSAAGGPGAPQGMPGMPGPMMAEGSPGPIPREICMVSLPPYTVAPPDVLFIDAARLVPKPPYCVEPLEVLIVQVTNTLPNEPINGPFVISPEGTINLGFGYGTVRVQGLTVDQIQSAIRQHLANTLHTPQVAVSLAQFRGQQQVRGEHLVRPDGTISLGIYGSVYVAGMTLGQVKATVEAHLKDYVVNPQVAVDVYAYNSKWYYVVFDGGGFGEQVYRLPVTGNETVLDAISTLQGLPPVSSLWRVWIARPAPCSNCCDQILMVDWQAIVKGGSTCTNYQLFPGDRVYVDADCLIKTDLWLAKVLAPVERVLGITLLGSSTYWSVRSGNNNSGN